MITNESLWSRQRCQSSTAKAANLGNEARFVPAAHGVGSESLSRVEMNALRAPLTALPNLLRARVCLTEADDFIDGDKDRPIQMSEEAVSERPVQVNLTALCRRGIQDRPSMRRILIPKSVH